MKRDTNKFVWVCVSVRVAKCNRTCMWLLYIEWLDLVEKSHTSVLLFKAVKVTEKRYDWMHTPCSHSYIHTAAYTYTKRSHSVRHTHTQKVERLYGKLLAENGIAIQQHKACRTLMCKTTSNSTKEHNSQCKRKRWFHRVLVRICVWVGIKATNKPIFTNTFKRKHWNQHKNYILNSAYIWVCWSHEFSYLSLSIRWVESMWVDGKLRLFLRHLWVQRLCEMIGKILAENEFSAWKKVFFFRFPVQSHPLLLSKFCIKSKPEIRLLYLNQIQRELNASNTIFCQMSFIWFDPIQCCGLSRMCECLTFTTQHNYLISSGVFGK